MNNKKLLESRLLAGCGIGTLLGAITGIIAVAVFMTSLGPDDDIGSPLGLAICVVFLFGGAGFLGLVVGLVGGLIWHAFSRRKPPTVSKED